MLGIDILIALANELCVCDWFSVSAVYCMLSEYLITI